LRNVSRYLLWAVLGLPLLAVAGANVVLKDLDGRDRSMGEFIGKGKWTVVAVWASDCPVCQQEIHHMNFFHDAHRKKDAQVLGVSVDGYARRQLAQGFVKDHGLDFTNLIAEPQDIARLGSGVFVGTPTYYVYSPEGKLLAEQVGPVTQEQVEAFIDRAKAAGGQ